MNIIPSTTGVILSSIFSLAVVLMGQQSFASSLVPVDTSLESRGYASIDRLVSTQFVVDNLKNENTKIIDVRSPGQYQAEHVPGALNYPYTQFFITIKGRSNPDVDIKGFMPPPHHISKELRKLGVKNSDTIIIYDHAMNVLSSRLLWTLAVYGHKDARMMDGSFALYKKEGRPVSTDVPVIAPSKYDFTGPIQSDLVMHLDTVLASVDDPSSQLIDVRSRAEFTGEWKKSARNGHVPNAIHFEWTNNVDQEGMFLPAAELLKRYASVGITGKADIVVMCQSGNRSSQSLFVLADLLGFDNVSNYDGSWSEYGNTTDAPIENLIQQ